jgi:hypothetical protein
MRACEAMVKVVKDNYWRKKTVYTMCGRTPVERHHRLTRARGGKILDKAGETYHLMDLCTEHHRMADGGDARAGGLVIDGQVTTCTQCRKPRYVGPDAYLDRHYGPAVHVRCVQEEVGGTKPGS